MRVIAQLCEEHRLLERRARDMLRVVAGDYPDPAAVAALRWRMAQMLREHCEREDRTIYEPVMASGDASATPIAWYYRRDHGALSREFDEQIARWPVARIAREWLLFRTETHRLMAELRRRIEREESVLYPHAARVLMRSAA